MILPADISTITQAHLEGICKAAITEGAHLDFKRQLPAAWGGSEKHDLAADAVAFANAGGGEIIYGINEGPNGEAVEIQPQVLASSDQETIRILDIIQGQTDPKVPGVKVFAVPVTVGSIAGHTVVVRIPPSWNGPHRVRANQHFYYREGARKRQLEIPEIRNLFLQSEGVAQRIRDFRAERLGKIISGELGFPLATDTVVVLHMAPADVVNSSVHVDPVHYTNQPLVMLGEPPRIARINLDGALAVDINHERKASGHTLLFRNGYLEMTKVLEVLHGESTYWLPSEKLERMVIDALKAYRAILPKWGNPEQPDVVVLLSLVRADQMRLGISASSMEWPEPFDRPHVLIPDGLMVGDQKAESVLKPIFDLIWQATGMRGSQSYNEAGEWAPRGR